MIMNSLTKPYAEIFFGSKGTIHSGLTGYGAHPASRKVDELRDLLFETATCMDEFTHTVADWEIWVTSLLEHLEFFAKADDRDHPEQYEKLLKQLKTAIEQRINRGAWE